MDTKHNIYTILLDRCITLTVNDRRYRPICKISPNSTLMALIGIDGCNDWNYWYSMEFIVDRFIKSLIQVGDNGHTLYDSNSKPMQVSIHDQLTIRDIEYTILQCVDACIFIEILDMYSVWSNVYSPYEKELKYISEEILNRVYYIYHNIDTLILNNYYSIYITDLGIAKLQSIKLDSRLVPFQLTYKGKVYRYRVPKQSRNRQYSIDITPMSTESLSSYTEYESSSVELPIEFARESEFIQDYEHVKESEPAQESESVQEADISTPKAKPMYDSTEAPKRRPLPTHSVSGNVRKQAHISVDTPLTPIRSNLASVSINLNDLFDSTPIPSKDKSCPTTPPSTARRVKIIDESNITPLRRIK